MNNRKILIERDSKEPNVLDCPRCEFALRDWEDYLSVKEAGVCQDCKTNNPKDEKDHN